MQFIGERGFRTLTAVILLSAIFAPVGIIVYQSALDQPFFNPAAAFGWDAFRYIFNDPEFYRALRTTAIFSVGMVAVCVPLGVALAFLMTRTDIKGKRWLEPLFLVPVFLSSVVLAFGYMVSVGPSGFFSLAFRAVFGDVPWNIYSLEGMIAAAGLNHVPHVYLYVSSAMRNMRPDLEEAARSAGASPLRVAMTVTVPLVLPAILFAAALSLLLGFEIFGLPLILGDPNGILVLTTYIYKLTILLGVPSYQLMAAVAVVILALTLPLVFIQRWLLGRGQSYATIGGKGVAANPIRLGKTGQTVALAVVFFWLFVAFVLPIGGIVFRSFVSAWGIGINPLDYVTLSIFGSLFEVRALTRGIINTVILATAGGAFAIFVYVIANLAMHRWRGAVATLLDYSILLPRALPGLVIGLAFFWLFLFVPFLQPLRRTLFALLIAYTVVGLSYGYRLIQTSLLQVGSELEEIGRTIGATLGRVQRDIIVPLIWPGVLGAWMLIFLIFLREYATGVYLMTSGTEVVGALIVSLLATGNVDSVAALSSVSVLMTAIGLGVALRLGVRVND